MLRDDIMAYLIRIDFQSDSNGGGALHRYRFT